MVLDLHHLPLVHAVANVLSEVWLQHTLQQLCLWHVYPAHGHKVDPLDGLLPTDTLEKPDDCPCGYFAKIMWCCGCHIELDVTDFEVLVFLEDSKTHLEEGHQ